MPASRQRSRSPFMACAVMATMGRCSVPRSRLRIAAVAAKPSSSGIWQSMNTSAYEPTVSMDSASRPLLAHSTV